MKEDLQAAMKEALRARDRVRLDTIRALLSALQYEEMQKGSDSLETSACVVVLQSELKKRREELEFAEKAGRADTVSNLHREIETISGFLPPQFSEDQLAEILTSLKAEQPGLNVGLAMKLLKDRFSGQYDGKLASEVARRVLV